MTDSDSADDSYDLPLFSRSAHTVSYCDSRCFRHWILSLLELTVGENAAIGKKIKNTSL